MRRLPEFGTLHAVGHSKGWLARRLTLETAGLAAAGWVLGILLAWGVMAILNAAVYAPKGFAFNPFQVTALPFVTPIPLAVIGFTLFTAVRALGRMDAVAIVERGELSLEGERSGRAARARAGEPAPPAGFDDLLPAAHAPGGGADRRHGVDDCGHGSTHICLRDLSDDAMQPVLNHLSRMSLVSPNSLPLDATVIAQIRAHPAVERVIPVYRLFALGNFHSSDRSPTIPSRPTASRRRIWPTWWSFTT